MSARESVNSAWLRLIRAEYQELPGMCLTKAQVQKMWGLDGTTCQTVLDQLVQSGFLVQRRGSEYVRAGAGY